MMPIRSLQIAAWYGGKEIVEHLTQLFAFLQASRAMPQYGYALAGIPQSEQSNLAEHHYLVMMTAWQLARYCNREGAELDLLLVFEEAAVHDLAEMPGGDIYMPYARANPAARIKAKAFEDENRRWIARLFGPDEQHVLDRSERNGDINGHDESVIAKIADYIECTHYRVFVGHFDERTFARACEKMQEKLALLRCSFARAAMARFLAHWQITVRTTHADDVFFPEAPPSSLREPPR